MAKIDVTRTELVWPGKYNEDVPARSSAPGKSAFPGYQTVSESRATRVAKQGQQTIYDYYKGEEGSTFEEGWKNKLIWGDNLLVMRLAAGEICR